MAKHYSWNDDNWLLVMQLFMKEPVGVKPLYCRPLVDLSIELHLPPQVIQERMEQLARLDTPRLERLWHNYSDNPKRLSRAARLLREMSGFNSAGSFYDGVDVEETFERDFRPLAEDERLKPVMLTVLLDLYFHLTPITMVEETPEVQETAKMLHIPTSLVVDVLDIFQHCDPYLNRKDVILSPLLLPCHQVWNKYGNGSMEELHSHAAELSVYFQ